MKIDYNLKIFTKTHIWKIISIIYISYFGINALFAFFGGYFDAYFKDYGNLLNYLVFVPSMFFFLTLSNKYLIKTIELPINENLIDKKHVSSYKKSVERILNQKINYLIILLLISILFQYINHYSIINDGKDKTIWLEGLPHSMIWEINYYFYYVIINAILLFCLLDATIRWIRVTIIIWKLYNKKRFGKLNLDNRYLIPFDFNPSFTIGKFLFFLSLVAIFVSMNYVTTAKINFGVVPNNELISSVLKSAYWILIFPLLIFFIPVFPIKEEHKKLLFKIKYIEYDALVLNYNNENINDNIISYIDRVSKLKKLTIWPLKITIVQAVYTLYLLPIVVEIIKNIFI